MHKKRAYYTADERLNILRKRLLEKVPISDLCDQYKLRPTVFFRWQKQYFLIREKHLNDKLYFVSGVRQFFSNNTERILQIFFSVLISKIFAIVPSEGLPANILKLRCRKLHCQMTKLLQSTLVILIIYFN